jgi:uncharacterized protein YaaN involved in tellurite resistance
MRDTHESDPAQPAGSDSFLPADPDEAARLDRFAAEFVETVAALDTAGRRYLRSVASVERLGQREFSAVAAVSGNMLGRRLRAGRGILAEKAPLARQLGELRRLVDEVNPARLELGRKRSRGPFGLGPQRDDMEVLADYFERFSRAQGHVEQILASLEEGHLALERDTSLLGQERVSLATVMETLRENAYLCGRLDERLEARIAEIALLDPARADCLAADILHAVRRRRQEILTQLAVATQGYASLQIVEESNDEMVRAIGTATATTAAALRTAAMVAQAVANQRMVADQIEAANRDAEEMADETGEMLARQSRALRGGVTGATARVALLRRAWDDVFAALDRVDAQKEQVLRSLTTAETAPPE